MDRMKLTRVDTDFPEHTREGGVRMEIEWADYKTKKVTSLKPYKDAILAAREIWKVKARESYEGGNIDGPEVQDDGIKVKVKLKGRKRKTVDVMIIPASEVSCGEGCWHRETTVHTAVAVLKSAGLDVFYDFGWKYIDAPPV